MMDDFVFANFFKIIKRYLNKTISNTELMYFLFEKVNKDNEDEKSELRINKSQVSRILSRTDDVPTRVRKYYCDRKNSEQIEELFEDFLDEKFEEGMEDELADELRNLYTDDDELDDKTKKYLDEFKDDDYSTYFSEIYIEVLKRGNKLSNSSINIYRNGNTTIDVLYDDLLKIAFSEKYISGAKIVVIPVNTTFDMITTEPDSYTQRVSVKSLHGKWIAKMNEKGFHTAKLNNVVEEWLRSKQTNCEDNNQKIGTISVIKVDNVYFYLLAISVFDQNYVARSNVKSIETALDALIDFYITNGQGYPIYLPLIGTGLSKSHISFADSYKLILDKFLDKIDNISGSINIVIYSKNKNITGDILNGIKN